MPAVRCHMVTVSSRRHPSQIDDRQHSEAGHRDRWWQTATTTRVWSVHLLSCSPGVYTRPPSNVSCVLSLSPCKHAQTCCPVSTNWSVPAVSHGRRPSSQCRSNNDHPTWVHCQSQTLNYTFRVSLWPTAVGQSQTELTRHWWQLMQLVHRYIGHSHHSAQVLSTSLTQAWRYMPRTSITTYLTLSLPWLTKWQVLDSAPQIHWLNN